MEVVEDEEEVRDGGGLDDIKGIAEDKDELWGTEGEADWAEGAKEEVVTEGNCAEDRGTIITGEQEDEVAETVAEVTEADEATESEVTEINEGKMWGQVGEDEDNGGKLDLEATDDLEGCLEGSEEGISMEL